MKRAQILLITLIVLSIIGIITVSVVILVQRDASQVASSENYEDAYNASEGYLNELLNKYSDKLTNLDGLLEDYGSSVPVRGGGGVSTQGENDPNSATLKEDSLICTKDASRNYNCLIKSDEFSKSKLQTQIIVKELNYLQDFPLYKDRTIDLNLGNYNDEITLSWTNNTALEFTIVYEDSLGVLQSVKDIYDPNHTFYEGIGGAYDHLVDPLSIHPIDFLPVTGMNANNSVKFILRNSKDINNSTIVGSFKYLRITNRTRDTNNGILLNLNATGVGSSSFPNQIREFDSVSFNPVDLVTPIAKLKTSVPLNNQPESLFDYAIITKEELNF